MDNNVVLCDVEKCVHNMNDMCNAQYINIGGHDVKDSSGTSCRTFELRNYHSSLTEMTNVNITGAVDQIFTEEPVMNPNIRCTVKECRFNSKLVCHAGQITVGDFASEHTYETKCRAFRKR